MRSTPSHTLRFGIAAIILVIVAFYVLTQRVAPVARAVGAVQASVYEFATRLRLSFVSFSEAQRLRKENEELRSSASVLQRENAALHDRAEEYEQLKKLLAFKDERSLNLVTARVITRNAVRQNTLVINAGSVDGITVGAPVVAEEGVLVGTVIDAKQSASTVLLLNDPAQKIAAGMPTTSRSVGIAQGEYGLSVALTLIPQNIALNEGDLIITSGLQDRIPRSLVIGTVSRVSSPENELFKSATLVPPVHYDELTVVSVLMP